MLPKWWEALCRVLEREDLITDERFEDVHRRQRNREELLIELDAAFGKRPRDEWVELLMDADVPCGPVNDYAAVSQDPQALENGYIASMEHPSLGEVGVVGSPITLMGTPAGPVSVAPELGQHTEEVLLGLGYDWPAIELLKPLRLFSPPRLVGDRGQNAAGGERGDRIAAALHVHAEGRSG